MMLVADNRSDRSDRSDRSNETQEDAAQRIQDKQIDYLAKTLEANLLFLKRQMLFGAITPEDYERLCDLNNDLMACLADVRDEYSED